MAVVSLLRCEGYSLDRLKGLIEQSLGNIAVSPESFRSLEVVVKPNLLSASGPESGIVTHPSFFQAACEIVLDHGGRVVLAESPAVAPLHKALHASGYEWVIQKLGITVADTSVCGKISFPGAHGFKSFEIARAFFDADLVLNLPKFKTHNLTYVTLSVKNLFGAVHGMKKSQLHLKCPGSHEFSGAILDLYGAFLYGFEPPKPLVHVMDAITALEGDGPGTGGKPRAMNAMLAGTDGLAVDWVAIRVSGLDPRLSPILMSGFARGYGVSSEQEITVVGSPIEDLRLEGFKPPKGPGMTVLLQASPVHRLMMRLFTGRPVVDREGCSGCRQCREICPAVAITMQGKTPRIDYGKCIRCYCCAEVCPCDAVTVRPGALQWILR